MASTSSSTPKKLFGREKPLHDLLGGGKGADTVLWRNKQLSAGILAGVTVIWLLFEVVGYHFITLLCHIAIVAMLVIFIWSNGAALLDLPSPRIPGVNLISEVPGALKGVVPPVQSKLRLAMSFLHDVTYGQDLKLFLSTIASLWMLSVIGSCFSFLSLLYFVFLCVGTLPALYEKFELQVDLQADKATRYLREHLDKFVENLRPKISRGPTTEKKLL